MESASNACSDGHEGAEGSSALHHHLADLQNIKIIYLLNITHFICMEDRTLTSQIERGTVGLSSILT